MNDDTIPDAGELPSARELYQRLVVSSQEAEQLRRQITDLLAQMDILRDAAKTRDARDSVMVQLREANENLVRATFGAQDLQAAAELANRAKEEFLSMLAHELRNPLAPIVMATELIDKILDAHPKLPKLHGIISRQASHLTHLVDDLLDASRISSGKFILQNSSLLLSMVIEGAIETSQPLIDKRRQLLTLDIPVDSIIVDGDPVRLGQVFSNLINNASKFTPDHGNIRVSAHMDAGVAMISIVDDGVGIAANVQPFIFDLFAQGPHSLDRSQGGLGIGLALVRTIVEMHGGTVKVISAGPGNGSEFLILLPISKTQIPSDGDLVIRKTVSRFSRILIIEDNADTNETLKSFLMLEGHTVQSALDGPTGLAMARDNIYDVIICDIGLPGMDGYEVVMQLRLRLLNPVPCFIAVTGYNQIENRMRAIDVGFDHYLVKPVPIEILLNLIDLATRNDAPR